MRAVLDHDYGCIRDRKSEFVWHHPIGRIQIIADHRDLHGKERNGTLFVLLDPTGRPHSSHFANVIDTAPALGYRIVFLDA